MSDVSYRAERARTEKNGRPYWKSAFPRWSHVDGSSVIITRSVWVETKNTSHKCTTESVDMQTGKRGSVRGSSLAIERERDSEDTHCVSWELHQRASVAGHVLATKPLWTTQPDPQERRIHLNTRMNTRACTHTHSHTRPSATRFADERS